MISVAVHQLWKPVLEVLGLVFIQEIRTALLSGFLVHSVHVSCLVYWRKAWEKNELGCYFLLWWKITEQLKWLCDSPIVVMLACSLFEYRIWTGRPYKPHMLFLQDVLSSTVRNHCCFQLTCSKSLPSLYPALFEELMSVLRDLLGNQQDAKDSQ